MEYKIIKVDFNAPLNTLDTENQTYGCRQKNPDICSSNGIENICAFVCKGQIFKKPSRAWKKQYMKLKGEKDDI